MTNIPRKYIGISVGICLVLLLLIFNDNASFVIDGGVKLILVQNLNDGSLEIKYPAKALDATQTLNPFSPLFFFERDSRFYAIYPPFFSLISLSGYKMLGRIGLYLPNIIGILLIVLFFSLLTRNYTDNTIIPWVLLISTPVFIYLFVFWEYTLFIGLLLGCLYYLQRASLKSLALSGLILGLALYLRPEALLLIPIVTLAIICKEGIKPSLYFFTAALLIILPLNLWNQHYYGSVWGYQLSINAGLGVIGKGLNLQALLIERLTSLLNLIWGTGNSITILCFILISVLALVFNLHNFNETKRNALSIIALVLYSISFYLLVSNYDQVFHLNKTQSLLSTCPLLLAFLIHADKRDIRVVSSLILIYAVLTVIITSNTGGIQWGSRFLLFIYPLVAISLIKVWNTINRRSKILLKIFIALSLLFQAYGLNLLVMKRQGIKDLTRFIECRQEGVILTDAWWLPLEASSVFYKKTFLIPRSGNSLIELAERFKSNNVKSFTYLSSPPYRFVSQSTWKALEDKGFKVKERLIFESKNLPYLHLDGVVFEYKE